MVDRPKTLLLIPGILNDEELWKHQVENLGGTANCRVVDTVSDTSVEGIVRRALQAAPERFAVAGLSMGGYVAFEFLRQVPHRVSHVAIFGSTATPPSAARAAEWDHCIALTNAGRFEEALGEELKLMVSPRRLHEPGWRSRVIQMGRRIGAEAYRRQHKVCTTRPDSRGLASDIRQPTIVVCGREDLATPLPLLEELAASIPGAKLCVIEDCGHLAPMEQPEHTIKILRDWLEVS